MWLDVATGKLARGSHQDGTCTSLMRKNCRPVDFARWSLTLKFGLGAVHGPSHLPSLGQLRSGLSRVRGSPCCWRQPLKVGKELDPP